MHPVKIGDLVLYDSEYIMIGAIVQILVSGEAHIDPFYRVLWSDPYFCDRAKDTWYDQAQIVEWRHNFLDLKTT